jgi:hypothetical protein
VRYEREVGPIPEGMELDHFACDNGPGGCCNPHHCRPVTTRENVLRGGNMAARCMAKTHCAAGHLLSEDNLVPNDKRYGKRRCRACTNAARRALRARRTPEQIEVRRERDRARWIVSREVILARRREKRAA